MSLMGSDIAVGTQIGKYQVTRNEPLDQLGGSYIELEHEVTGSKHVHVAVPDDNKGLAVVFPTVPQDSSGVAHILEHLALAGSKSFPGKDPFFSMFGRSLQTFMNAFTGDDATLYLFSTRNEKDFYNLANVYLDSAFFPLLRELSFKQEGHRLEFEDPTDPNSGLRFKGVVFNETKGYAATPIRVANEAIGTALYPDLTYAFNSGGDPQEIPNLTYQALKEFHASHYHPSNALFVSYGDQEISQLLDFIHEKVLKEFERHELDVSIPDQERFSEPRVVTIPYPLSKDETLQKKSQALVAWITTHSSDSFEILGLKVLEQVLLGNAASPVKKALIDSGLGDALFDWGGLRTDYKEAAFVVGLKGTDPTDAEQVESIVLETLESLVKEGLDPAQVDAAIHQLEISSREISNSPPYPYAISMIQEIAHPLVHGADPYPLLQLDANLKRLEAARRSGQFFEEMIRRYFLDNPHRALIIIEPDHDLEEKWRDAEMARLSQIEAALSDEDKHRLVQEAAQLKALQEQKEGEDLLPQLELSDIPMTFEDVPHEVRKIEGATVGLFPQPTNGLTYIDIRADFSTLPSRLKQRLGIFATALTKSGAAAHDYLQMARRIDAYTGGLSAAASTRTRIEGGDSFRESLSISGKALVRNNKELVSILSDIVTEVTFEPKRLREVIAEQKARYDSFFAFASAGLAIALAGSKLSKEGVIDEYLGGITYYKLLRDLSTRGDDLADVVADLETIKDHLFRSGNLEVCITSLKESIGSLEEQVSEVLRKLPSGKPPDESELMEPALVHEAKTLAVPVNSNVKVINGVDYDHPDSPALLVLSQFIGDKYLHPELREKGGAYGAQATFRREGGQFIMLTSQDPNVARTYRTFDEAVGWVAANQPPGDQVTEAILSACNLVDPLLAPDTKGRARFFSDLAGYTLERQEAYKKRLLEVTAGDLQRVAAEHLAKGESALVSIGNPEAIGKGNEEMGEIFEISPV